MLNAQVLINREWVELSGNPGSNVILSEWNQIDWTSSSFDSQGDLIVVGNTQQAAGNTDILVSKYNRESGTLVWETTYNGPVSGHDYGVSVLVDGADNVIVAGVVSTASGQSAVQLLKYSSSGSLVWSTLWTNPSGNLYDVPTAMTFDNSGNIIVIGGSINASLVSDWIILKFDSSGNILWNQAYDYASHQDLPTNVVVESNNNVSVLGFSEDMPSSVNFVGITFAEADGAILSQDIKPLPEISGTSPASVVIDANHDVYIAATTNDAANSNVKLIKISGSNLVWVKNIDEDGLADVAKSVIVDHGGSIVLATESENVSGGHYVAIRKYSSSGNELFLSKLQPKESTDDVRATKLRVDIDNNIFLLGEKTYSGDSDIFFSMYSSEGNILGLKEYSGDNAAEDHSRDIQLSWDGGIFVTGKSTETTTQYATIKYERFERDTSLVYIGDEPSHRATELIVRFKPEYVNTSFIDNDHLKFGDVGDALLPTAASDVEDVLAGLRTVVSKFYRIKTTETWSVTRLGDTIPIPKFWSSLLFHFSPIAETDVDLDVIIAELEGLSSVLYAEKNGLVFPHTIPNDPLYGLETSLASSEVGINIEPAWDLVTGTSDVRVGIVDLPIFWQHEDFVGTTGSSRILGGHDYFNDVSIFSVTNPVSHGTSVAGILGATRDNGIGIAGISGGGLDALGNFSYGTSLFSLGIFDGATGKAATFSAAAAAIVDASLSTGSSSHYGVHVLNNSWGWYGSENLSYEVLQAVETAFDNQVIFVASKGNDGLDDLHYPSDFWDQAVLSVGASGNDTKKKNELSGDAYLPVACQWASNFGNGVDFLAPGYTEAVVTTINPMRPHMDYCFGPVNIYPAPVGNGLYQPFNGTSASAPHVSGVAALMYGLHNTNNGYENNLAIEDVEFLLQKYAKGNGYSDDDGWGLIDAGAVVQRLEAPEWRVFHSGDPQTISLQFVKDVPDPISPNGIQWKQYKVTHTYSYEFPNENVVDFWKRNSSTLAGVLFGSANQSINGFEKNKGEYKFSADQNKISATASVFVYKLDWPNSDTWAGGISPDKAETAFSVHLQKSPTSTFSQHEKDFVQLFPNPTQGDVELLFDIVQSDVSVLISDLSGKILMQKEAKGVTTLKLNLSSLAPGVYHLQLVSDKLLVNRQIVKQ